MYDLQKNKMTKEWYYPSGGPPSGIMPLQTRNYSAQVESNQQFHYLEKTEVT